MAKMPMIQSVEQLFKLGKQSSRSHVKFLQRKYRQCSLRGWLAESRCLFYISPAMKIAL